MTALVTRTGATVDLGVDLAEVYRRACNHLFEYLAEPVFPNFDQLFEEYLDLALAKLTNMPESKVSRQLKELQTQFEMEKEEFDVETGFRPEHFGIAKDAEFLNALVECGYSFYLGKRLVNPPIVEVW